MLLLKIFHVLMALGIIVGVLLQSGKSAGMSGIIDGGASQLFGKSNRGLDEKLSKLTTVVAILFMITSITLAIM
ncbi:MAG: preprotein translocase subunit SecG [Halanaerobiaceae bacterium]